MDGFEGLGLLPLAISAGSKPGTVLTAFPLVGATLARGESFRSEN